MKKISVGCSPLSNTIFAGKLNKEGDMWVGNRDDVTDEAVSAVAQHLLISDTRLEFEYKGETYVLKVSKVEQ